MNTNTATNTNDGYDTRPPSTREQPAGRALQQRRDRVRKIVIATRAALLQLRAELDASLAKTLPRLDAMEAWANGGQLPAFATEYTDALHHVDSATRCECGRCATCKADKVLASFDGVVDLEDGVAVACNAAMGTEIGKANPLHYIAVQLDQNLIPEPAAHAVRVAARRALRGTRGAA